jgi:hypothetical protein
MGYSLRIGKIKAKCKISEILMRTVPWGERRKNKKQKHLARIIMADNSKDKNKWSDFIVTSIGACLAAPEEKKSNPCIVVAYIAGGEREASFITLELPSKNKLYTRDDFLAAIKTAEGVKNVTYATSLGAEKEIYLCRDNKGKITDVVARNYEKNAFAEGFAEVLSLADDVVLVPIYPAREEPIEGVCSEMIGRMLTTEWRLVERDALAAMLGEVESDIVVTFGAGNIDVVCNDVATALRNKTTK